ncbi:MAG: hypothetical protein LW832_07415 [Parachlamydia sp.]|jgi:hypothetical protein|nr:hypothetical protein [Parachlamydia sp.]
MKKLVHSLLLLAAAFAAPAALSADHCRQDRCNENRCNQNGEINRITNEDVVGTYQVSGFSNSRDGAGTFLLPQSQAAVGQLTFFEDNTGVATFLDLVVVVAGQVTHIARTNVPFIWSLDNAVNGRGFVQLFNFPTPGSNPTFVVSFRQENGCVTGLTGVTAANSSTGLWTLLQGERFN